MSTNHNLSEGGGGIFTVIVPSKAEISTLRISGVDEKSSINYKVLL